MEREGSANGEKGLSIFLPWLQCQADLTKSFHFAVRKYGILFTPDTLKRLFKQEGLVIKPFGFHRVRRGKTDHPRGNFLYFTPEESSMRKPILLVLVILAHLPAFAAGTTFTFQPFWGDSKVVPGTFFLSGSDSVRIDQLKFYISPVLVKDHQDKNGIYGKEYRLIDLFDSTRMQFNIPQSAAEISFGIGVDSLVTASGVYGGDLDPANNMYWTWQSGYVNFKLEGYFSALPDDHLFRYHIGGYQHPFNTYSTVQLKVPPGEQHIIRIDLEKLILNTELQKQPVIMSPNESAMKFVQLLGSAITIQ